MSRMINLSYCQFLDILINALRLSHKNTRLYNRQKKTNKKKKQEGQSPYDSHVSIIFKVKVQGQGHFMT